MERAPLAWLSNAGRKSLEAGSKSAYASKLLLPILSKDYEITLFTDEKDVAPELSAFVKTKPLVEYSLSGGGGQALVQFEDRLDEQVRNVPTAHPRSVFWLHDWYLRAEGSTLAERLAPAEENAKFAFSSSRNAEEFRRASGNSTFLIPYPAYVSDGDLDPTAKGVCFCGSPLTEDHAHSLLRALSLVADAQPMRWMISPDEQREARRVMADFPTVAVELVLGKTAEHWAELLQSSAYAAHLRFSAYGDYGPFLGQSMLAGIPILLSRFGDALEFAAHSPLFVDPGEEEVSQLVSLLGSSSVQRVGMREVAAELFHPEQVAAELRTLIESV